MSKRYFLIMLVWTCTICEGQNLVLNGDFENNIASTCLRNLDNSSFDSIMFNCSAFGLANELDIQNSSCPYSYPASGNWFISLDTKPNGAVDALSLTLRSPLISGNRYTLSYFEKADTHNTTGRFDSLLVGLSTNNLSFGTQIYSSQPVVQTGWTLKSFSFIVQTNSSYLTFKNKGTPRGWNFIDNIQINLECDTLTLTYTIAVAKPELSNGAMRVSVSGGDPPYQYSLDSLTFQSSNTFTSLALGNYQVYVTDSSGCTGQGTFIIDETNCNCNH